MGSGPVCLALTCDSGRHVADPLRSSCKTIVQLPLSVEYIHIEHIQEDDMTIKPPEMVPVSFRVTPEELDALKKAAAKQQRSVSGWLRYYIVTKLLPKGTASC